MNEQKPPEEWQKEGLQAAIDFTKFLLTLSGGAIAFVIQPTFFAGECFLKGLAIVSLVCLGTCVISGLLVFSAGSVMLARKNYDLEFRHVKYAGMVNIISFALGFIFVAIAVAIKVIKA
jgi:hypothetical protein